MKAIFFAPGKSRQLDPLTSFSLPSIIPVLNQPLMQLYIKDLVAADISEMKIIVHNYPEQIDNLFGDGKKWGAEITYSFEKRIPEDFKALGKFKSYLNESFVFIPEKIYAEIDYKNFYEFHKKSGNILTILAGRMDPLVELPLLSIKNNTLEKIKFNPVESKGVFSTGIFLCEPEIVKYLDNPEINTFDQLLNHLMVVNKTISVYQSDRTWEPLRTLRYYWQLNIELLKQKSSKNDLPGYNQVRDGLYIKDGTTLNIAKTNEWKFPILIGKNCSISKSACLQGPVIIGDNCIVDDGAIINKSIIFDNTYIGKMVEIKESVISKNCHINVPLLFGTFVEEDFIIGEVKKEPLDLKINRTLINFFDKIIAFTVLICLSPLFLLVALLIKLDSKGPVFYVSKRLKKPARKLKNDNIYKYEKEESVKYYVFRTMYVDADKRLKDFQAENVYEDGPFRKIKDDPRVTPIGRILRKTSIDELPLFINVLKGDMSLVGIWALPTYEAEDLDSKGLRVGELDLSETAKVRFHGRLGLAGYWQARGRSNLTAEERALHDSYQSALISLSQNKNKDLKQYSEIVTFKGYLKVLHETFIAVVKRRGAQ